LQAEVAALTSHHAQNHAHNDANHQVFKTNMKNTFFFLQTNKQTKRMSWLFCERSLLLKLRIMLNIITMQMLTWWFQLDFQSLIRGKHFSFLQVVFVFTSLFSHLLRHIFSLS
jgi:hypothetical protein